MLKLSNILSLLVLPTLFSGCKKNTICNNYLEYPDCMVESRSRFYGMYRGVSSFDNSTVITQWEAKAGPEISQIILAGHVTLELDYTNPHYFKVKEGSHLDGNLYIRHDGNCGRFENDSLFLDFWVDEGVTQVPGEKRSHYTFAGKRK